MCGRGAGRFVVGGGIRLGRLTLNLCKKMRGCVGPLARLTLRPVLFLPNHAATAHEQTSEGKNAGYQSHGCPKSLRKPAEPAKVQVRKPRKRWVDKAVSRIEGVEAIKDLRK